MLQSIWTILEAILFKLENNWKQIDISTVIFCLRGAAEDVANVLKMKIIMFFCFYSFILVKINEGKDT